MYLKTILRIILVSAGVALCGCGDFESTESEMISSSVNVVFAVGNTPRTRTEYDVETKRFVWKTGDEVAVWAKSPDGSYALDNQAFRLMAVASDKSEAYFTATLQSPMAEGTYSYYMTYPLPESMGGMTATFTVPSVQDGTASDGVDIIVAEPISGPALEPVKEAAPIVSDDVLNVRMRHLLHFLRFYIPEGHNVLGEPVKRIEVTMPQAVAGKVSVDVTDVSTVSFGEGVNGLTLELRNPIDESADGTEVAVAGIFPPRMAYSAGDRITVDAYSENKCASVSFSLAGRDFAAGHTTKVPLKMTEAKPIEYELKFMLASNNLGEDVQDIRITLPDDAVWPGLSSSELRIDSGNDGLVRIGDTYVFRTKDKAFFKGLSSKRLAVTYESESAVVSETVTLGDFSSSIRGECELNCPYLFFEDFSWVEGFNSNDEYGWSSPGSFSPHLFAPYTIDAENPWSPEKGGWSAARAGAQAGTAIRIACRRETRLANYSARADSPFLSGLKDGKTVNLDITYDYSMGREGTPKIAQTVYFGYITTSKNPSSGDETGTFPESFKINETTGSYTNINHTANTLLRGVGAPLRLSWRTMPDKDWGANNNTCWLYIDNIKVKIKK